MHAFYIAASTEVIPSFTMVPFWLAVLPGNY